jgi:hypothetical protein
MKYKSVIYLVAIFNILDSFSTYYAVCFLGFIESNITFTILSYNYGFLLSTIFKLGLYTIGAIMLVRIANWKFFEKYSVILVIMITCLLVAPVMLADLNNFLVIIFPSKYMTKTDLVRAVNQGNVPEDIKTWITGFNTQKFCKI